MPYLENGAYYVHNSEMVQFRRCRLKHYYGYVLNLVPLVKPRPLYLGTIGHVGLQYYYLGRDPIKAMNLAVAEDIQSVIDSGKIKGMMLNDYINEANRRLELCINVMQNYIEYDKQFPIFRDGAIASIDGVPFVEQTFEVPIDGLWLDNKPVLYRFTVDLGYEQNGGIWIVDHKTGKQFLDVRKLDLDTQLSQYIWGLNKILDKRIIGMEYNLIRMANPRVPELVKKGDRLSVAAIDTTWEIYEKEIRKYGFDPEDYEDMRLKLQHKTFFDRKSRYRTPKELVTIEKELKDTVSDMIDPNCRIYRNPTNDCTWDCPYREICIMQFKGEDESAVQEYIDNNFVVGANRRESNDHIGAILDKV